MYLFKRIWNLELVTSSFFQKDIKFFKNCECKLRMKISNTNCDYKLSGRLTLVKDKVNFKVYDVTSWSTNSYNTDIAQYLMKLEQQVKYFSSKIMHKWGRGTSSWTVFVFRKALNELKAIGLQRSFNMFQ